MDDEEKKPVTVVLTEDSKLKEENEDLKAKLSLIAEKQFNEKKEFLGRELGLNEEELAGIENQEDLLKLEGRYEERKSKTGSISAEEKRLRDQLKGTPTGGGAAGKATIDAPTSSDEFESYGEMMDFLRKKADIKPKDANERKERDAAVNILNQLHQKEAEEIQRALDSGRPPEPMVFTGKMKDIADGVASIDQWKPLSQTKDKREKETKHVLK